MFVVVILVARNMLDQDEGYCVVYNVHRTDVLIAARLRQELKTQHLFSTVYHISEFAIVNYCSWRGAVYCLK